MRSRLPLLVCLALLGAVLARASHRPPAVLEDFRHLDTPAPVGSREPSLSVAGDGTLFVSWLDTVDSTHHALRISKRTHGGLWSEPVTVAQGDSFFVSGSDVPAIAALGSERLMVAWMWLNPGDGYHIRIAGSLDGGRHWTPPIIPHRDGTATEHGFVSLVTAQESGVRVFWLDGRKYATEKPDSSGAENGARASTSLRTAWVGFDGALADEAEVDDRVCDCCPTSAVGQRSGAVVAYRDRTQEDVRDISVAWLEGHRWTEPMPVHLDGWQTKGCPVSGPALAADSGHLAVAWMTQSADSARVQVAFSNDHGRTFGAPLRVDQGNPLGRASVVLLDDGSALVAWLESQGTSTSFLVRRARPSGEAGPALTVATTRSARAIGIPRMVRDRDTIYFAWTAPEEGPRVRLAVGRLPS